MANVDDVLNMIREADIEIDTAQLAEDVPLNDQGVDSLDLSALMAQVEKDCGVAIAPDQSNRLRTVRDFVDFLNSAST
jgi:acyl carrier protein